MAGCCHILGLVPDSYAHRSLLQAILDHTGYNDLNGTTSEGALSPRIVDLAVFHPAYTEMVECFLENGAGSVFFPEWITELEYKAEPDPRWLCSYTDPIHRLSWVTKNHRGRLVVHILFCHCPIHERIVFRTQEDGVFLYTNLPFTYQ